MAGFIPAGVGHKGLLLQQGEKEAPARKMCEYPRITVQGRPEALRSARGISPAIRIPREIAHAEEDEVAAYVRVKAPVATGLEARVYVERVGGRNSNGPRARKCGRLRRAS
jgi:hypothetical protein